MNEETTSLAIRVASIPDLRVEDVLDVMNQVEIFQRKARELRQQCEEQVKDYILEHGEIEVGDKRWYVGVDRKHKPALPMPELVALLMEETGGDFDRFCELLASDALKPGACKKVLGERFDEAFETKTVTDLKTGEPRKSVRVFDKRFAGGRG